MGLGRVRGPLVERDMEMEKKFGKFWAAAALFAVAAGCIPAAVPAEPLDLDAVVAAYHGGGAAAADWRGVEFAAAEIPEGEGQGTLPLTVSAGTGAETRVVVDVGAANAASEGWPWWGKALVIGGCVVVAGLATWAVVEACDGSGHNRHSATWDNSQTLGVDVSGQGNSVTVHYYSPSSETHSTETHSSSTETHGGGESGGWDGGDTGGWE